MKKNIILIIISSLLLLSCNQDIKLNSETISHIDVYYISFGVLSPIDFIEENILSDGRHIRIIDQKDIKSVCEKTLQLEPSYETDFMEVYLRIDFYTKEKRVLKLLFDKRNFKVGKTLYAEDEKLVNFLIKKFENK